MIGIYLRQSVIKDDSLSIETQLEECQKKMGGSPERYEVYEDRGKSGKNVQRPEFQRMMRDIERGVIKKVIVYRLDRLSRSVRDFSNFLSDIEQYKVEFVSCKEDFDTTTSMGKLLFTITAAFAELERNIIVERVTDNYYHRAELGMYLGGPPPYAFDKIKIEYNGNKTSAYTVNPERAKIVLDAYTRYATTNISLGQLVRELNLNSGKKRMILNDEPGGKRFKKSDEDSQFSTTSFARVLRNPANVKADAQVFQYLKNKGATMNDDIDKYDGECGCYVYAEREGVKTRKFTDLKGHFVTLAPHRGFVPADLWLACQYKLDENKQITNSGRGKHSWLSGLMKCGYCDYAITVVNNNRGRNYINCLGRRQVGDAKCTGRKRTVLLDDIQNEVEKQLLERLQEYIPLTAEPTVITENAEIKELKNKIALLDNQIENLTTAIGMSDGPDLAHAVTPLLQQISKLQKEREELAKEIAAISYEDSTIRNLDIDLEKLIEQFPGYSLETKKQIANIFIQKVIVSDRGIQTDFK